MLHRNLLYTGVTRGKRLVILVGEKKACAVAVYGTMTKPRHTKLQEWGEIYRKLPWRELDRPDLTRPSRQADQGVVGRVQHVSSPLAAAGEVAT
jgi:hypothetical protein